MCVRGHVGLRLSESYCNISQIHGSPKLLHALTLNFPLKQQVVPRSQAVYALVYSCMAKYFCDVSHPSPSVAYSCLNLIIYSRSDCGTSSRWKLCGSWNSFLGTVKTGVFVDTFIIPEELSRHFRDVKPFLIFNVVTSCLAVCFCVLRHFGAVYRWIVCSKARNRYVKWMLRCFTLAFTM